MLEIKDFEGLSRHETPFYYYDMDLFGRTVSHVAELSRRYGVKVHYAVKANAEPRLVRMMAEAGFGADCVSGGEVAFAVASGFASEEVMFAGVGKTDREIEAALSAGIGCFNVESLQELSVIDGIAARMGVKAPVAFRINPNIDAHTHRYVTTGLYENKFGISDYEFDAAIETVRSCTHLAFKGLQFHIGSQITLVESVFSLECERVRQIIRYFEKRGLKIESIDLGGGLGVDYDSPDEHPVADFETWMRIISMHFADTPYSLHIEPGRSLVAQCGSLVSRVVFVKHGQSKTFLILDAGMNDLIRPALYGAYHKIENLSAPLRGERDRDCVYDVVGPVCESSDVWGEARVLHPSQRGDLVCIRTAGAYGSVMASRYNLRELAPAVFSDEL